MKILIIGYSLSSIELLQLNFSAPDFQVISAHSPHQTISIIDTHSPDIILLDIPASPETIQQSCKTLKEIKAYTTIPVIVLSVNSDPEFIARVLNTGADDYISKPISYPVLVARINTLIRRMRVYSPVSIT